MPVRPAAVALGILLSVLALTGCDPVTVTGPSPTPSGSAAPDPSASPSGTATPVAIPTDCTKIVSEEVYASTFGDTPLNDPGFGPDLGSIVPTPAAADATPAQVLAAAAELFCVWGSSQADITQLNASFARVDPAFAIDYFGTLPSEGFTCGEMLGGQRCQRIGQNEQYPVEEGITMFLRDGVYIHVYQANFPTNNLLGAIVEKVWGTAE